jgi:6-phosphogluconolactonase/glucosamine-6-phosphate isomerase/deaminase
MAERELEVLADADAVARRAASIVAASIRAAADPPDCFSFAVSGGRTPWLMFAYLAAEDVRWDRVAIWQVDERIAPQDDPGREPARGGARLGPPDARRSG